MNRKLKIATGKSRKETIWRNREVSWEWLRDRLKDGRETSETSEEYRKMSRDRQSQIKDIGGFVGGYLRDGLRKKGNIECRSVVTLDYDGFSKEHLEGVRSVLRGTLWAAHSTHKHSDADWRVRFVIPTDRDMTSDEYGAVSRKVAESMGFEGIDRTTFQPERLMYWGSHSKGAPYLFEEGDGDFLKVDEWLGKYHDWQDITTWPLTPEEEGAGLFECQVPNAESQDSEGNYDYIYKRFRALAGTGKGAQQNPEEKKGIIGAFCRTYDIDGAIQKFLPDTYRRKGKCHYTYVNGSTSGGAWSPDGKFLYSFHSTDPVSGKLVNAWDLVRIHKFGNEDTFDEDKQTDRLPSFKLMENLAMEDPEVRIRLQEEREKAAITDFEGFDLRDPGIDELDGEAKDEYLKWEHVRAGLDMDKTGALKTNSRNIVAVLKKYPKFAGKIRLDEFSGKFTVFGELPWRRSVKTWTNNDAANLRVFLDKKFGISGKEKVSDGLISVAVEHSFHPVRDYLDSLEWDGKKRLGRLFIDVLGAEDTPLNQALAELIFTAAVRRIRKPGEKFDYLIILHGPEGCGKSSLFSLMGGEWFTDSVVTIEGKEGMESIQGKWIVEMGELAGMRKSELETQKRFVSSQVDSYRPAYGTVVEDRPRQCIMVGTTNEDLFLRGLLTGNRRNPIVEINPGLRKVPETVREYVAKWRDQLWAEANELEKKGEPLYLGDEYQAEIKRIQDEHNADKSNPLFPMIDEFLDYWLPFEWETMDKDARDRWRQAQNDYGETGTGNRDMLRQRVSVPEILQECFEMKKGDREYNSKCRLVGQYLNSLAPKWKMVGCKRTKLYGVQKVWERDTEFVTEESLSSGYNLEDL